MNTNDYRNTEYCPSLSKVSDKKEGLRSTILEKHPRVKNIYKQIKNKDSEYNKKFRHIYNHKCGYCGVSQKVIDADLFEVDHYICESSFNGDKIAAGQISNLVLACRKCNRNKGSLFISDTHKNVLSPDDGSIAEVFYRDDKYYIKISERYQQDVQIMSFYDQLELSQQVRRLDYLLMNMEGLCDKIQGSDDAKILGACINELRKKRNNC